MLLTDNEQALAIKLIQMLAEVFDIDHDDPDVAAYLPNDGLDVEEAIDAILYGMTPHVCGLISLAILIQTRRRKTSAAMRTAFNALNQRLSAIDKALRRGMPASHEQASTRPITSLIYSLVLIDDARSPEFDICLLGLLGQLGQCEKGTLGDQYFEPGRWETLYPEDRLLRTSIYLAAQQDVMIASLKSPSRAPGKALIQTATASVEQASALPLVALAQSLPRIRNALSPEFDTCLLGILAHFGQFQIDALGRQCFHPERWKRLRCKDRLSLLNTYLVAEQYAMCDRLSLYLARESLPRPTPAFDPDNLAFDAVRAIA